jgi:hypothetical protein
MAQTEHKAKGSAAAVILLLLSLFLFLPLLYALSLGPVMMIYQGALEPLPLIEWFYQPLIDLINSSEWLSDVATWYLSFWVD